MHLEGTMIIFCWCWFEGEIMKADVFCSPEKEGFLGSTGTIQKGAGDLSSSLLASSLPAAGCLHIGSDVQGQAQDVHRPAQSLKLLQELVSWGSALTSGS